MGRRKRIARNVVQMGPDQSEHTLVPVDGWSPCWTRGRHGKRASRKVVPSAQTLQATEPRSVIYARRATSTAPAQAHSVK